MTHSQPAIRIRLAWEEGKWILRKVTRVHKMTLLPSVRLPRTAKNERYTGFWVELVDQSGNVMYRRGMRDPTLQSVEVHNRGIPSQHAVLRKRALIDIAMPENSESDSVRIFGQQISIDQRILESQLLATLKIKNHNLKTT